MSRYYQLFAIQLRISIASAVSPPRVGSSSMVVPPIDSDVGRSIVASGL